MMLLEALLLEEVGRRIEQSLEKADFHLNKIALNPSKVIRNIGVNCWMTNNIRLIPHYSSNYHNNPAIESPQLFLAIFYSPLLLLYCRLHPNPPQKEILHSFLCFWFFNILCVCKPVWQNFVMSTRVMQTHQTKKSRYKILSFAGRCPYGIYFIFSTIWYFFPDAFTHLSFRLPW